MTEIETALAGVSVHPGKLEWESRMIRYFAFDFSTGECDGGDCADIAWETQYVDVPVLDLDEKYVRLAEQLDDDDDAILEHLCETLHGHGTIEAAICYIRA